MSARNLQRSIRQNGDSRRQNARIGSAVFAAAVSVVGIRHASAASSTWVGPAGGVFDSFTVSPTWDDSTMWAGGNVPGIVDGTTSTDIATFDTNSPTLGYGGIILAGNRNIGGITWDIASNAGTGSLAFGVGTTSGPNLILSAGGTLLVTVNNITNNSPSVNAPVVLMGNASFVNMANLPATSFSGLKINNSVTPGVAGPVTLTLDGTNRNSAGTSSSLILGAITDGAGKLTLVKNATGTDAAATWSFNQPATTPNTYSGDTIINGGYIRINGPGALSPNSNYYVNSGGSINMSVAGGTMKSLTISGTGGLKATSGVGPSNVAAVSGPSVTLDYSSITAAVNMTGFALNFTGAVAGQGGVKLIMNDGGGSVSLGNSTMTWDIGSVSRPFDIGASSANVAAGMPDLQMNMSLNGSGGIVKTGPGVLKLNNATNNFSSQLEIQNGVVRFNSANALTSAPPLLVDGGEMDISSNNQTFGTVTMTAGTISTSTTTPSAVAAPSFTLNVAAGSKAVAKAILADSGAGSATVTKSGAGSATLSGNNTYTGVTTVQGGRLILAGTGAQTPVLTGAAGANITGGRLVLDYSGGSTPATTVKSLLTAAAASNFASGQIRSSTATATKGLGWADNAAATQVTIAYTYKGDANCDGQVDVTDLGALATNWQTASVWAGGDFNYDGFVDVTDLGTLATNWQAGVGNPLGPGSFQDALASVGLGGVTVPEPATLSVLSIGAMGLIARRRRN